MSFLALEDGNGCRDLRNSCNKSARMLEVKESISFLR